MINLCYGGGHLGFLINIKIKKKGKQPSNSSTVCIISNFSTSFL